MGTEGNPEAVTISRARLRVPRVSWLLLTTVTMLPLNALFVWLILGVQPELTGRTWEQFAAQDPEVASIYAMYLAVLAIIWAALVCLRRSSPSFPTVGGIAGPGMPCGWFRLRTVARPPASWLTGAVPVSGWRGSPRSLWSAC